MERNTLFHPPAFLGSGFRQNHQIRALKSNSLPFLSSHRSVFTPSGSHTSPSVALLSSRAALDFQRTNINSHRRAHLRRCYDLFHLAVQRRDLPLAARFLRVLLGAHEWSSHLLWQWALLLCTDRLGYLQQLDLEASSAFKALYTTSLLVAEYIANRRINDAIELLEQRVNVHPYKARVELHAVLGMLYVYVGVSTLLSAGGGGELRAMDKRTKGKARMCFETALQAEAAETRAEMARRMRVWGMRSGEEEEDAKRVRRRRERVWGTDVAGGWEHERQGEEVQEHQTIRRVRRRLHGEHDENADGTRQESQHESEGDDESSASGSLYTDDDSDSDSTGQERGRSRTPSRITRATPDHPDSPSRPSPPAAPTKGPQAWARAWTHVAPYYTPNPPLASHLAQSFLAILNAPSATASASQTIRGESLSDGEDEGDGTVGGVELTREEAELRLRRILFEGEGEVEVASKREAGDERRIKKESRDTREKNRKHDRSSRYSHGHRREGQGRHRPH